MSIIRNLIENERGLHTNSVATDNELVLKQDKSTLLNALKAVDGAGSGLDADLVRGAEPVKLSTAGTELTKIDGSTIKNQCTAWVNFDGTDGTIRDSYNVSSVVRTDEGKYTISFASNMSTSNYSVTSSVSLPRNSCSVEKCTTSDCNIEVGGVNYSDGSTRYRDESLVTIAIFGGKN